VPRAVAVALAAALGVVGCTASRPAGLGLSELIARNADARGGRAAIEAIRSLEARLRIVEPTYSAEGLWRVDRRGRMRIDVSIGGKRVFTEAFDGRNGWQRAGDDAPAKAASADGSAALRHSAELPTNVLGLHEMGAHGHRLALIGREEIGGTLYYAIDLTLDDGFTTRYFVDPESFLVTRSRVRKALHPDNDPTPTTIETVWSDFRRVSGVLFPFEARDTDLATGKLLQTTTLLEMNANRPADDGLFPAPEETQR
jgi:hypothetical protein